MSNGNYRIRIGAGANGEPIIGARACESRGAVDTECVYGIQIGYRCTAMTPAGPRVCTPTEARTKGWQILHRFAGPAR